MRVGGKRSRQRRRAVVAVETALVVSLVLLLIFAVVEYGRYLAVRAVVENAVREGGRFSVVRTVDVNTHDDQVRDRVHAMLAGFQGNLHGYDKNTSIYVYKADPTTAQPLGSWKDAGFGEYIAVGINASFRSIFSSFRVPGLGEIQILGDVPIQVRVLMYSEAN